MNSFTYFKLFIISSLNSSIAFGTYYKFDYYYENKKFYSMETVSVIIVIANTNYRDNINMVRSDYLDLQYFQLKPLTSPSHVLYF